MTPEELTIRRVNVDLPRGRLLRVERWDDTLALFRVWPEQPDDALATIRVPGETLPGLVKALREFERAGN